MVTDKNKYNPSKFSRFIIYPIVFLLFLAIFIVILIYANGYKFDIKNNQIKLVKTGMLIVASRPSEAVILLNDKDTRKKSAFTFFPVKIPGLLPGNYKLTLKKDGFRTWEKTIAINPNLVTWENYVLLFPLNLKITKPDTLESKKIIAKSDDRYLFVSGQENNQNAFFTYDQTNNSLKKVWPANSSPIEPYLINPDIKEASFNIGNNRLLLKVANGDKFDYAILDFSSNEQKIYSLSRIYKQDFSKAVWSKNDENELFATSGNTLNRINLSDQQNITKIASNVVDYGVERNLILVVTNDNQSYQVDQVGLDGGNKQDVAQAVVKAESYKMSYSSGLDGAAVLPSDGTLTIYRRIGGQMNSIQLGKGIVDFKWSNNNKTILYFSKNNIYKYDFEKQKEYVSTPTSEVKKVDWFYDDMHFVVLTTKGLMIEDYDGTNQVSISSKQVDDFYSDERMSNEVFTENDGNTSTIYRYSSSF